MKILITIGKIILEIIYGIIKAFPTKRRVAFISRQADEPSLDIMLLTEYLEEKGEKTAIACKTLKTGLFNVIGYCFHMLKQMYLIATSEVVVLDSYCIVASLLHHKKKTKIVQMWHALGSLKKFGYSILDKGEGSRSELARLMKMHNNYDYFIASSHESSIHFAEAFNCSIDKCKILSLPRVDVLVDKNQDKEVSELIYDKYPQLKVKNNILYAPTFRKNADISRYIEELIKSMNGERYNMIIKLHPLSDCYINCHEHIISDQEFSTLEMLSVADYVITDYSAITYEAALKKIPMYFYAFDLKNYENDRSFYLDYKNNMPGIVTESAEEIMNEISKNSPLIEKIERFSNKYVKNQMDCTNYFVDFLVNLMVLV